MERKRVGSWEKRQCVCVCVCVHACVCIRVLARHSSKRNELLCDVHKTRELLND